MKWHHDLKLAFVAFVGLLACHAFGQSEFFTKIKLEATVVVARHPMGSDLVEITILGTNYPPAAIEQKVAALGREVGDQPRGLQASAVEGKFVKANFAVNGLITDTTPKVNIVAIAKALAFGDHPIRKFSVFFQGVAPDRTTPARWFAPKDAWLLEGMAMRNPPGIEYRVQVNTNDPNEIYIPGNNQAVSSSKTSDSGSRSKIFIFGGIILSAIAIGVLVYSALLRPRPSAR